MSRIRIRNFGPLGENQSWIEIGKVIVFIGNQGSGKSTAAKLISTFVWMEKALNRGDYNEKHFQRKNKFRNTYLAYHRIQNYLRPETKIDYEGESYSFKFSRGKLKINRITTKVDLRQIMYVPAERNFLSYIESFKELKMSSASLRDFKDEYRNALKNMKNGQSLPTGNATIEYDKLNDIVHIKSEGYKIRISESASGYQSFVPMCLVSRYLAQSIQNGNNDSQMTEQQRNTLKKLVSDIVNRKDVSEDVRRGVLNEILSKYSKSSFFNIVEEPEQNLFPKSQFDVLTDLLATNNLSKGNNLVITTHSPYILAFLPLFVKAKQIYAKATSEQKKRIGEIVSPEAHLSKGELSVYEFDENIGKYSILADYKGMPSDENYLNISLAKSNDRYADLLDIEDECK